MLGRYRLERRLGAGGFGVVWMAWDEKLEREVAVKAIPRERGAGEERVEREARAAARLSHPAIVGIYELASDAHDVYLVSELVRGRTLAELLHAGALADRDVARIGAALCEALEHAHARGVIHRDVKPQNVMVVAEPAAGVGFAKLADFGVAHVVSGDPLTRTGDVVGTLAYMAPEQAEGARVSGASDVYSLALTLYECWTGRNPVRAGGPAATARRLGRPLPSLAALRRDLPIELCDAIDAALDIDPARRPAPGELRSALAAAEPELGDEG
ncbi:MAG TPA: serine/threonine-protein kinase, partial [Thermoleophilaceae bacterium]|nr:serine/threonine-protein kinase [Thermoleophilaceae bacterium]